MMSMSVPRSSGSLQWGFGSQIHRCRTQAQNNLKELRQWEEAEKCLIQVKKLMSKLAENAKEKSREQKQYEDGAWKAGENLRGERSKVMLFLTLSILQSWLELVKAIHPESEDNFNDIYTKYVTFEQAVQGLARMEIINENHKIPYLIFDKPLLYWLKRLGLALAGLAIGYAIGTVFIPTYGCYVLGAGLCSGLGGAAGFFGGRRILRSEAEKLRDSTNNLGVALRQCQGFIKEKERVAEAERNLADDSAGQDLNLTKTA